MIPTPQRVDEILAMRSTDSRKGDMDALSAYFACLRSERDALMRLVAGVPDLVKSAFQEGFAGNESLPLGQAWNISSTKNALDGQANPRHPSWDADKDRIAILDAQNKTLLEDRAELQRLQSSPAPVVGGVPEPTDFDIAHEYFQNYATVYTKPEEQHAHKQGFLAGVDWAKNKASRLSSIKPGEVDALDALRAIWPFVEEDDGGFATKQYQAAIDKVRAVLDAQATTNGEVGG